MDPFSPNKGSPDHFFQENVNSSQVVNMSKPIGDIMTSPRLHTGQKRVSLFELGNTQKTNILINNEVQHEYD